MKAENKYKTKEQESIKKTVKDAQLAGISFDDAISAAEVLTDPDRFNKLKEAGLRGSEIGKKVRSDLDKLLDRNHVSFGDHEAFKALTPPKISAKDNMIYRNDNV